MVDVDGTLTKICTECGKPKPATTEYFHTNRAMRDGLTKKCKVCRSILRKDEYQRNKETAQGYYINNREQILERTRVYYHDNREQILEKQRDYKKKNKQKIRQYEAKRRAKGLTYRQKRRYVGGNLDKHRQYHREYNRQYRKRNREKIAIADKQYRDANRERYRVYKNNYVARKRQLPDALTPEQWQYALDYFNGCCAVCGRPLKDLFGAHTISQDHWIPVSSPECPGTVATNIIPLCHGIDGCNNSKQNTMPYEWLKEQYGTRKANEILARVEAYFEQVRYDETNSDL